MNALEILTYLVWLVASVSFILALKFLASPKSARTGNLLGAAGMALVVTWTLFVRDGQFGIPDTWWIIVVGGATSNNTRELVKTCAQHCARVHHVQTDADLRVEWVLGAEVIGLTAGTSTPDEVIDRVESRIRSIHSKAHEACLTS